MIIRAKKSLASMHNERNFSALDRRIKENKKIFVKNSKVALDKPQTYKDYIQQLTNRG